jgi:hypothetical protein
MAVAPSAVLASAEIPDQEEIDQMPSGRIFPWHDGPAILTKEFQEYEPASACHEQCRLFPYWRSAAHWRRERPGFKKLSRNAAVRLMKQRHAAPFCAY